MCGIHDIQQSNYQSFPLQIIPQFTLGVLAYEWILHDPTL